MRSSATPLSVKPRSTLVLPTALLTLLLLLWSGVAGAASYQRTDGTIVDPIQCFAGCTGDHPYSGPNLRPSSTDVGGNLNGADLRYANLSASDLSYRDFTNANLLEANLTSGFWAMTSFAGANLSGSNLDGSILDEVDFSGANLTNVYGLDGSYGESGVGPSYNLNTDFTGALAFDGQPFDPVASGWTLVPEPNSALLIGIGLSALAVRREKR